ncbi:hypothetical protein [Streptomyces sp. BE147]|uniref:hypothetical protein n=1 Tax=unclassified Streptomyces TaxID=2593676 RepID=UPI002E79A1FA|nr:hypothetical protein [Streptomyces sp. BE147]MEE1736694.1 hypothetical protein [Streptomyces sp. BE147]
MSPGKPHTTLRLSALPKLFMIDLDGVVLRHNGHLVDNDALLPGAERFWQHIRPQDVVVVLTSRPESWREQSLSLLAANNLRVDSAIFGLPPGERVVINDRKPSGMSTAFGVNIDRDDGLAGIDVVIDNSL